VVAQCQRTGKYCFVAQRFEVARTKHPSLADCPREPNPGTCCYWRSLLMGPIPLLDGNPLLFHGPCLGTGRDVRILTIPCRAGALVGSRAWPDCGQACYALLTALEPAVPAGFSTATSHDKTRTLNRPFHPARCASSHGLRLWLLHLPWKPAFK
jgi:hypothetical protein